MIKQARLLDIENCNKCKHLDLAKNGAVGYVICKKEKRVITELGGYSIDMIMQEVDIPEWCSLPVIEKDV